MITLKHKKEAERLRLALMSGCENAETVIAWADSIIQEQAEPDYCFELMHFDEGGLTLNMNTLIARKVIPGIILSKR